MPRSTQTKRAVRENELKRGRIVADFGRHVLVEDDEDLVHPCTVRDRRLRIACGDRVYWQPAAHGGRGVVESLRPRVSELTRPDARGRPVVLAANLDQLIVVSAVAPQLDPDLIDRYLVAAAIMEVEGMIVFNKAELATRADAQGSDALLGEYETIPYTVLRTSAKTGRGLERLAALMAGRTSIFVGQSGVGKSSLLNALRPHTDAAVGTLSSGSGAGAHTTSASVLYKLPGGGEVIDSPGVREYAPHLDSDQDPASGYVEFLEPARDCRFRNCRHLNEPDCAVKAAVAQGRISRRRYESYRTMVQQDA